MIRTRFTDLIRCSVPIQSAPITARPAFLAQVAAAGALPMMGTGTEPPAAPVLADWIRHTQRLTEAPIGINLLVPFLEADTLEVAADMAPIVEFFFGDPDPRLVEIGHGGNALVSWQVGSTSEAHLAADSGCDFIVLQGREAGGHVRGTEPLMELLESVRDRVEIPIVTAGGVATATDLARMLDAGSDAVRLGTLLVASDESIAHPHYKQALLAASAEDTVLTETFTADWKAAPHRVLRSCVEAVQAHPDEIVAETVIGESRTPVPRLSTAPPTVHSVGAVDAMALYAGTSVAGVHAVRPVAEIITELCDGAQRDRRQRD